MSNGNHRGFWGVLLGLLAAVGGLSGIVAFLEWAGISPTKVFPVPNQSSPAEVLPSVTSAPDVSVTPTPTPSLEPSSPGQITEAGFPPILLSDEVLQYFDFVGSKPEIDGSRQLVLVMKAKQNIPNANFYVDHYDLFGVKSAENFMPACDAAGCEDSWQKGNSRRLNLDLRGYDVENISKVEIRLVLRDF